jgi:NADH-quinone oxidoreductase subunit M
VFAVFAALGVILGAVYMLWLYQRMMFGDITHEANRRLTDLCRREIAVLVPIVLLMFWIGIYPWTFLHKMEAASAHLLDQMRGKQALVRQGHGALPAAPAGGVWHDTASTLSTGGKRTP